MAELVDALDSKSCDCEVVSVRFRLRVLRPLRKTKRPFLFPKTIALFCAMANMKEGPYFEAIKKHYVEFWGKKFTELTLTDGPAAELGKHFKVLEFEPQQPDDVWCYATVGTSNPKDGGKLELFMLSSKQDTSIVELLYSTAYLHRTGDGLGLDHTVNFGKPWQDNSKCDHAIVSPPYTEPQEFMEIMTAAGIMKFYWLLPITKAEREYKIEHGAEKLEELFEAHNMQYWDANRESLA